MNWIVNMMKKFSLRSNDVKVGHYVETTDGNEDGGVIFKIGASPYYGKSDEWAYVRGWWLVDGQVTMTWGEWYPVESLRSFGKAKKLSKAGAIPSLKWFEVEAVS